MTAEESPPDAGLPGARTAGLWFMVIGPLLAAYLQQQLTYMTVTPACERHMPWLVHLPLLPGLFVLGLSMLLARREWERGGQQTATDVEGVDAVSRLFTILAFALGGLGFVLILAQWIPTLFLHPCQR